MLLQAVDKISDLIQTLDRVEPNNSFLYCSLAKGFARVVRYSFEILLIEEIHYNEETYTKKSILL